ncbi:nucleotidyltransferase domain-containing protein [Zooshikella ganghwensis]|uniref:nucleotidyltransferase domain-containing protein n=1 Tax=Zooshikella ganghwensis TaxID=202772 RepID=UPI00040F3117|nr:nucleotidyltransferase domain-containing protein [Zooshikella ganghwensis]
MSSTTQQLMKKNLLPGIPPFLSDAVHYEVIMGSMAYGVSNDSSDMDVYGFAIPPKSDIFPHLRGEIPGFDLAQPKFQQYQQHHIYDSSALGGRGREYDLTIYSIAKYFRLLMDNNPNIVDSLYVPRNCILHSTAVGERVREQRKLFLHKGCWAKFKGYAYAQMHKMKTKQPEGKRAKMVEQYGYDVKFAYHVVRLLLEVEQLLIEQDMDLTLHKEQLKAIRRGEWDIQQVKEFFIKKEQHLEQCYEQSKLPFKADQSAIRQLLLECLEMHYGSLSECIRQPGLAEATLDQIQLLINQYQQRIK